MARNIAVQDAATIMTDEEETVEHAVGRHWNREEVHGDYGFTVVAQKSQPTFGRLGVSGRSSYPAEYGCFRYHETEHVKFSMDAGRSPSWILRRHPEDQLTNLS